MQNGSPFCIPVEFPRWNFPLVKCAGWKYNESKIRKKVMQCKRGNR